MSNEDVLQKWKQKRRLESERGQIYNDERGPGGSDIHRRY